MTRSSQPSGTDQLVHFDRVIATLAAFVAAFAGAPPTPHHAVPIPVATAAAHAPIRTGPCSRVDAPRPCPTQDPLLRL